MADFIEESGRLWDHHARRDPLWAILSDPARTGGRWDLGRFMQTGVGEVAALLYELQSLGITVAREAALDFGCGVGRLSQALAPHFKRVTGVDVSAVMVEKAQALNRFPQSVSYVCNQSRRLERFPDHAFDFILSNIVLQHIRPDIGVEYLREFFRLLAPGGALVFQLPSHARGADDAPAPTGPRAMPDEAYLAAITVLNLPEEAGVPGAEITLHVAVSNRSPIAWRLEEHGLIRAGNHWSDAAGRMLVRDDGRTALPPVLRAGETCHLDVVAHVPVEPGRYHCELDLSHEGVTWFHDKGSPRTRVALDVGGAALGSGVMAELVPVVPAVASGAPPLAESVAQEPEDFPMFGVPSDEVIALIKESGLTLRHIEDDHSCGRDWISYRYFVTNT
jgi:SAM-dependent methyltransferase